ncbi:peptidoglycan-binding protein, partial [Patescibacteria group bacterium]|nr:peptidoglycan-binding protein [Patescibacteria group bacterium]
MKKIAVSIVGLSMIVMLVPGIAQGLTADELQAQITALTAQLTALQAQLTGLTGAPAACTFTRALYPGVSGADVKCLQQYLNGAGYAVAASGVGSAGNETQYYGSLTQAAVGAWQTAKGVVCGAYCGYFGPVSQAKYVALGGAVTPVTPVTPTDLEGGAGSVENYDLVSGLANEEVG